MARVTTSSSHLMALSLRSCIPTPSLCRRVLNSGGVPSEWESEALKQIGAGLLRAPLLPLLFALIHPSAWNRHSANFAFMEFCELRPAQIVSYLRGDPQDRPGGDRVL